MSKISSNSSEREKVDTPLYQRIKNMLIQEIGQLEEGENRLPPEEQLAKRYGTSRATIRESLADLIRHGYITSWQGRGNFGHPHALDLNMRFDITTTFHELLVSAGYQVEIEQSIISLDDPSVEVLEHYPEWEGEDVFSFDWNYCAQGTPLIACKVQVLKKRMRYVLSRKKDEIKLTDYLRRFYNGDITYATTWFKATRNAEVSAMFQVPEDTPLLSWEESFYDLYDRQICFNQVFFHPRKIKPSMLLRT